MEEDALEIERTCRYGHGPLVAEDGLWAVSGVTLGRTLAGGKRYQNENGLGFSFQIQRCATCGYVEIFDKDS